MNLILIFGCFVSVTANQWLKHDADLNFDFSIDIDNFTKSITEENYKAESALVRCEFLPDEFVRCGFDPSSLVGDSTVVKSDSEDPSNSSTVAPVLPNHYLGSDDIDWNCNQWNLKFRAGEINPATLPSELIPVCTVFDGIMCFGERRFRRLEGIVCDHEPGEHYFPTTLLYSLFLGFFGVDRFALGHTETGVGKMLTLGGFGVWWVIDVILLAAGQLLPRDGSGWAIYY